MTLNGRRRVRFKLICGDPNLREGYRQTIYYQHKRTEKKKHHAGSYKVSRPPQIGNSDNTTREEGESKKLGRFQNIKRTKKTTRAKLGAL